MTTEPGAKIKGQMTVQDCIDVAETDADGHKTKPQPEPQPEPSTARSANGAALNAHHRRSMTAAQIVACRLRETE
ncbi:MAG: hypothetical protein H0T76_06285 [Nannocystis sp.]|nr:hypothetical protein [Nannocystis sp.]MBA3546070.1 hypothetical protein [Nannocystis sp.]